jgi:uncharacterized membrane protein
LKELLGGISGVHGNVSIALIAASIFCAFGVLLVLKAVPPNRWFGLRTDRTLADSVAWYRAHQAFGWLFIAIGAVAAGFSLWPTTSVHPAWGLVGVLMVAAAFVFVYRRYAA